MRKYSILTLFHSIVVLIFIYTMNMNLLAQKPTEPPLRMRILAHSNHPKDQEIKKYAKEYVLSELYKINPSVENSHLRESIHKNLPQWQAQLEKLLQTHQFTYPVSAQLGQVYLPDKIDQGTLHPAGYYETLLITLGEGKGDNFFCVLFPICGITTPEKTKKPLRIGCWVCEKSTELWDRIFNF